MSLGEERLERDLEIVSNVRHEKHGIFEQFSLMNYSKVGWNTEQAMFSVIFLQ